MTKKVMLLLADGFEPLEAAGFTDVLGWANIDGSEPIQLISVGLKAKLTATFGFSVIPDLLIDEVDLDDFDAIAIPGGFEGAGFYKEALGDKFGEIIRYFDAAEKPVASVCVASLAVAASGCLKGRKATVYHQVGGKRKAQLEESGAIFIDSPVVKDNNIITSTGPGTAIEVAFQLLEDLTCANNVAHIRRLMRMPAPDQTWFNTPQVAV